MKKLQLYTAAFFLTVFQLCIATELKEIIDRSSPGDTITISPGTYTQPISIDQAITLAGSNVIFKMESNQPAIEIVSRKPVTLKNLNFRYQTTTKPQNDEHPFAVYVNGGNLLIEDCHIEDAGRSGECLCAVSVADGSTAHIKNSRFEGFIYTIQFWNESKGSVENCLIMNPGHCGITIGNGSSAELKRNIITGSRYHGIRCTGGEINADSNLVIANKNRGFYIGNKSATGTLSNNLIIDNATGINVFANSKLTIANNVILHSSYAGLAIADTATLDIQNNIIANNERGVVGFSSEKGKDASVRLRGENIAYGNTTQTEGIKQPTELAGIDPQFETPESGLYSSDTHMGLTNPEDLQLLWKKWRATIGR